MAGLVKELLLDMGLNRLSIDQRSDISTAIATLISAGVIKRDDLLILDQYIAGYTATEIAVSFNTTTDIVEEILTRITQAIEYASGYTDESLVYRVRNRYAKTRIPVLTLFLTKHGQRFHTHEI